MVMRMMRVTSFFLGMVLSVSVLAEEAAKTEALALFDGKSLEAWEPVDIGGSGTVEVEEGEMILSQGESLTGAVYKKSDTLPVKDYEITLEAMRLAGVDFFVGLTFPVRDHKTHLTLVMGGWGGSVTGISSIDGLDASENNTGSFQRFEDNKWYKVKLRVTEKELKVSINDKEVIDADIVDKKLGLRPGPMESFAGLSLTTFQTTAAIRNVKLTPLATPAK